MLKTKMTYVRPGPERPNWASETAGDCREFVQLTRNRNDSTMHVFPGLTLVLSALRET